MNNLLTKLGIPLEIQAFFGVTYELSFSYGDQYERYGPGYHIVPSTQNLWTAGLPNATHLIITYSVMEAMAFITLNRHRFPRLDQIAFIAIGNRLYVEQVDWIRQNYPGRKITLIFDNDIVGHITSVKVAGGIRNIAVHVFLSGAQIHIVTNKRQVTMDAGIFSLYAFEEAFALRPRFRSSKPRLAFTFLDQLKYDSER
ncbi:hypothetical protein GWR56_10080 [Mucilaginibacter sp. 14171R-50]|uniref:hypothetical protein n=1 Tax=Mucilaginibacter sp. 14171R-50 TaxID=2703789 RepID=UPI00138B9000|nr:hypothetical protein [Mucilaginibacter sp. 14171R-50]QHS55862.1 hypothetical protein GWR56_10080 [Mucilaginibacter sp. 14171R-50]